MILGGAASGATEESVKTRTVPESAEPQASPTIAAPTSPRLEVKLALLRRNMPQYEAARRLGMSETRFSRILCGRADPTAEEAEGIARLVGERVEALFGRQPADDGSGDGRGGR